MKRIFKEDTKSPFIVSAGWLFADLLLAIAMLFLAAGTFKLPVKATPTPGPTATFGPTATPNPRVLEHNYCRIVLQVDPNKLNDFPNNLRIAEQQLEPQLAQLYQHGFLRGRHVGIAVAYGGANDGNEGRGSEVSKQTYNVLRDLANKNTPFTGTSYYDDLFTRLQPSTAVVIDVYLVVQQQGQETCNSQNHPV